MPWKGVTVSEQRQRFIEDNLLNYYTVTELAERFGIFRRTAHKWINRYKSKDRRDTRSYPDVLTPTPGEPIRNLSTSW